MKTLEQRVAALEKQMKKVLALTKRLVDNQDMNETAKAMGSKGGTNRMSKLTPEQRRELAMKGVAARRKKEEAK